MKRNTLLTLTSGVLLSVCTIATANTIRINIAPDQVPDEQNPNVALDSPAGWGPHSWADIGPDSGNKVNWHARYNADGDYLSALFPEDAATLTISALSTLSINLKSSTEHWFLKIYTRPDEVDDNASWYGERFTVNYGAVPTDDTWRLFTTDGANNGTPQMLFNNDFGTDDGLTLSQLQATYGSELIEMISIQTDSGIGNAGLMDGLVIELNNSAVGEVNFVPEPTTALIMAGSGLALMFRRRRKVA